MPSFQELLAELRFAAALPRFFRNRVSIEEARETMRHRLARREEMFFHLVRDAVFGRSHSPYRWLLERARVELGDIENELAASGLDRTLSKLRAAGLSVGFEEFKGRKPLVLDGAEFPLTPHSFDNPVAGRHLSGSSSGSTGAPTSLAIDLRNLIDRAPGIMIAMDAHRVLRAPMGLWRSILPSIAAITSMLRGVVMGNVPERWFSPLAPGELKAPLKNRLATEYIVRAGRFAGAPLPRPEYVPFDRAGVVAEWGRDAVARAGRALLRGHVSSLSRVAAAAVDEGIDLRGVVLWGGGEPPTEAKIAPILRSGAEFLPTYYLSEAGAIGLPCVHPSDLTDVHVMEDSIAVVGDESWSAQPRQMLWLTSLLPSAPKLMINVESDDVATVERRRCGCPLEAAGLGLHIRQVRSARKLTSEGMRVLGIDVLALVEDFLPSRFGGVPQNFQIVEEEDASSGRTRIVLVVDPAVQLPKDGEVRDQVLAFIASRSAPSHLAASTWRQAESLIIRREPPKWNAHGKLPPLLAREHAAVEVG